MTNLKEFRTKATIHGIALARRHSGFSPGHTPLPLGQAKSDRIPLVSNDLRHVRQDVLGRPGVFPDTVFLAEKRRFSWSEGHGKAFEDWGRTGFIRMTRLAKVGVKWKPRRGAAWNQSIPNLTLKHKFQSVHKSRPALARIFRNQTDGPSTMSTGFHPSRSSSSKRNGGFPVMSVLTIDGHQYCSM